MTLFQLQAQIKTLEENRKKSEMTEIVYYKDKFKCAATNLKEKENVLKEVINFYYLF